MRLVAGLLTAVIGSSVLASEPGQPLDCSDWVFVQPGYSCSYFFDGHLRGDWTFQRGSDLAVDNQGGLLRLGSEANGVVVVRLDPITGDNIIGFVHGRPNGSGDFDRVTTSCTPGPCAGHLVFDPVNGRLIFGVYSVGPGYAYSSTIVISGFPSLFDISQSYQPQLTAWAFRVPASAEALGGVDHFGTYWGPLTHPLDFTHAHPLGCGYPASSPHVGDFLTVADTVPTPSPGQGVYYVTSATYQGATRYGRQQFNGHLSGRDPALLPACPVPEGEAQ
jgi:hypothetical protein